MLKKSILALIILIFSISLVSAITSEPKNPILELTSETQLTISTETGPILVQLQSLGDLKGNLIISQEEFELSPNLEKTVNLKLKAPIRSKEYMFINTLYLDPRDDIIQEDNTIMLEVISTSNKPLKIELLEDTPTEKSEIVQLSFNIFILIIIGLLVFYTYKKKWQEKK